MKILILGGYGVFGGRLAELLSDIAGLELLICGRNQSRAADFCTRYQGDTTVRPLRLDRKDIEQALATEHPDLVVDASGPFQNYGDDGYNVIKACIAAACMCARMGCETAKKLNKAGILWRRAMMGPISPQWPLKRSHESC